MSVPGIGPIISSAVVAAIGTGDGFAKGRDFAAWLGLVPRQISTGDRTILGKISKRGNRYLRVLFVSFVMAPLSQKLEPPKIPGRFSCGMALLREQEGHAYRGPATEFGRTAETLRGWVRQAERDEGKRAGLTTDERERIKALEREVRELRQANEILRAKPTPLNINLGSDRFAMFNKVRDIPGFGARADLSGGTNNANDPADICFESRPTLRIDPPEQFRTCRRRTNSAISFPPQWARSRA